MSVLHCDRNGCGNIMCDNMINGYYICNKCLHELKHVYTPFASIDDFFNSRFKENYRNSWIMHIDKKIENKYEKYPETCKK